MDIPATNNALTSSLSSPTLGPELDKQAFLRLLVTQMRYQDPLDPLQNEAFVSQLAEFSSLESLNNISEQMTSSTLLEQSVHNALSTALIGKYTLTVGDTVEVGGDSVDPAVYVMPEAGDVEITVYDDSDNIVYNAYKTDLKAGEHLFQWEGINNNDDAVENGTYRIEVAYAGGVNSGEQLTVLKAGKIHAVRFLNGSPILVIDGLEYRMADVLQVMEGLPEAD